MGFKRGYLKSMLPERSWRRERAFGKLVARPAGRKPVEWKLASPMTCHRAGKESGKLVMRVVLQGARDTELPISPGQIAAVSFDPD